MMEGLERQARQAGERAAAEAAERLAEALRAAVPGVSVTREPGRVVLAGRGLRRRLLADPLLRWPGGLLR